MFKKTELHIIKLLKKLNQNCIYATINKNNKPSLNAIAKLGYKPINDDELSYLKKNGFLSKNQIRFEKCYKI